MVGCSISKSATEPRTLERCAEIEWKSTEALLYASFPCWMFLPKFSGFKGVTASELVQLPSELSSKRTP